MTYNFKFVHELQKVISLNSLTIWTWDQKEMKVHPLIFLSILHLHFSDQGWINGEYLKNSPHFPNLATFYGFFYEQINSKITIPHHILPSMFIKPENMDLELLVDQKSTWSTLTLTDFDQNDHFAPCIQLINFQTKLNLNLLLIDAQ